ncbi:hypothetical protein Tco_1213274 [Tanacetum coccineum]
MNSDHNLWNIVLHGNNRKRTGRDPRGNIMILPPVTMKEQIAVQRETKARTILLQSLPEDHMAEFHHLDDAEDIWLAVKARFGGNEESKKMRKSMLKQEFADFKISESEGLHKGYDRFQKVLSQLNQMQARPDNEDCNMKFLRALPPSWSQVAITLKTKGGLDFLSFDDLYNKLRTLEIDVKGGSSYDSRVPAAPTHSAFISAASTNSKWSTADSKCQPSSVSYTTTSSSADASGNLDLEELDIKWQMAMLSVRINRFEKKAGRKFKFNNKDAAREKGGIQRQVGFNAHIGLTTKWKNMEKGASEVYGMIAGYGDDVVIPAVDAADGVSTDGIFADGVFVAAGNGSDGVSVAAGVGADGVSVTSSDATDAETQFALMGVIPSGYNLVLLDQKFGLGYGGTFLDLMRRLIYLALVYFDSCLKDAIEKPLYDWFVKPIGMHAVPPITGTFMPPSNKPDIDDTQFTYGSKSNNYSESNSVSNDFVSCETSDKSSDSETTGFASCASSVNSSSTMTNASSSVDLKTLHKTDDQGPCNVTQSPSFSFKENVKTPRNLCNRNGAHTCIGDSLEETMLDLNKLQGFSHIDPQGSPSPKVHTASATVESTSDYAEELARLQGQAYEANSAAKDTWKTADTVPAGSGVPATSIPAGSINQAAGGSVFSSPSDLANHISSSSEMEGIHHHPTTGIFSESTYDADFGGSPTNLAPTIAVDHVPTRRVHTVHLYKQILGYYFTVLTRGTLKIIQVLVRVALAGYVHDQQRINHSNISIKLVPLPEGKTAIGTKWILKNKRDARGIVVRNESKAWCTELEVLMKGDFEMSAMVELTFFLVSACSRHQVTPLTSNLNAVKKIFKYLKGQPNLVLCCKRQTVVATSSHEARICLLCFHVVVRSFTSGSTGFTGEQFLLAWLLVYLEVVPAWYVIVTDPLIYDSLITQFWSTASLRSSELVPPAIVATIDGTPYTISLITSEDTKSGSWDQFGTPLAIALICLCEGKKFLQMILDIETRNTKPYRAFRLTSKIANMRLNFYGDHMPLVAAMLPPPQAAIAAGTSGEAAPPNPQTDHWNLNQQGPSSDPHVESSSKDNDSNPDPNVADDPLGGSFFASPSRSTAAPPEGTTHGGLQPHNLTALYTLVSEQGKKIESLESGLQAHKLLFKDVMGKLVKRVKFLESKLKARGRNVILSEFDIQEDEVKDVDSLIKLAKAAAFAADTSSVPADATQATEFPPSSSIHTDAFVHGNAVPTGHLVRRRGQVGPAEAARKLYEEEQAELARVQEEMKKKRQEDVINSAKYYNDADWSDIMGQVHANQGLTADLLGPDVNEDNLAARMATIIAERRRKFAAQRFQDKRNKPMTYAQQRDYMRTFVKNQSSTIYTTGWTLKHVRSFSDDQLKDEFDKIRHALANLQSQHLRRSLKRQGADLEQPDSKKSKSTEPQKTSVPAASRPSSAGVTPDVHQSPFVDTPPATPPHSPKASSHPDVTPDTSKQPTVAPTPSFATPVSRSSRPRTRSQSSAADIKTYSTRRKSLATRKMPSSEVDLNAPDTSFIKVLSDDDSDDSDDDTNPLFWHAFAAWEVIPTGLGDVNALYFTDKSYSQITFTHLREILHLLDRTMICPMLKFSGMITGVGYPQLEIVPFSGVHVLETFTGKILYMFADTPYPLSASLMKKIVNLIERMLDHQLEICHDTVGNELTTAVQLIAFLKKQISDSRRPKVHDCPCFNAVFLVADSKFMKVAFGVGFKMLLFNPLIVTTGSTTGRVIATVSIKVPTGSSNAKFPYLKKDEYETWALKMEYWIMNSDHNLWNIVLHGNSRKRIGRDPRGNIMILPPVTMEEQIAVQQETKAITILLQSLPEDHMANFHQLDDAKDIWLAVKARFGGNEESKKMRKSMLKQEFIDFKISN